MTYSLTLLGSVSLQGPTGPVVGPAAHRHRLALLALLACAPSGAIGRDKLLAWLWPESDEEHARKLLNQAVHKLRKVLGEEAIQSPGIALRLNPQLISCDVNEFERAVAAGDPELAVSLYSGPFLDGFFLPDAIEFEHWVDRERTRLAAIYASQLESLSLAAEATRDFPTAVRYWTALTAHDPFDSRVAHRLVLACEAAGNPAGALSHLSDHQRLLHEEFGVALPPEMLAVAERLRRSALPRGAMDVHPAPGEQRADEFQVPQSTPSPDDASLPEISFHGIQPAGGGKTPGRLRKVVYMAAAAVVLIGGMLGGWQILRPSGSGSSAMVVEETAPERRTTSTAAYEFYLRGTDPTHLRSLAGAQEGLSYFLRAIELDSGYAAAHAGAASMYVRISSTAPKPRRLEMLAAAEASATKAIELDESLSEAHNVLGYLNLLTMELGSAEQHLARAIQLDPTNLRALAALSELYVIMGRPQAALSTAERALAIDPLSAENNAEAGRALAAAGRCEEALERLTLLANLDPPLLRVGPIAAQCMASMGRWEDAIAQLERGREERGQRGLALLGYVLAGAGRVEEATMIRESLLEQMNRGTGDPFAHAILALALSDHSEVFRWLNESFADGTFVRPGTVTVMDPVFAEIRSDPRFAAFRTRAGF